MSDAPQDVLVELLADAIDTRKRGDDAYQRWPLDLLVGLQRRIEQLEAERDELHNQNESLRHSVSVLEAREQANYERGLEDAAGISDGFGYAVEVSEAIRAQIQEKDDE